jgi:hypothetical protein
MKIMIWPRIMGRQNHMIPKVTRYISANRYIWHLWLSLMSHLRLQCNPNHIHRYFPSIWPPSDEFCIIYYLQLIFNISSVVVHMVAIIISLSPQSGIWPMTLQVASHEMALSCITAIEIWCCCGTTGISLWCQT